MNIIRYARLYAYFLQFSFSRAMEFRMDFWFRVVMDIFYYAMNVGFYKVLFTSTTLLAGWNEAQTMVFVAGFLVIDAINMTVFANNLWGLGDLINKGDLDYYLIRPVSSLFILSLRDFAANSFVNLIAAVGLLAWAISKYPPAQTVSGIAFFAVLIVIGSILRFLVHISFLIPVFWIHSGRGLENVYYHLNRFVERPDKIYTGIVRVVLTTIVPFACIASFPARIFIDGFSLPLFAHFVAVTVAYFGFVVWFWTQGLKAYSSASS